MQSGGARRRHHALSPPLRWASPHLAISHLHCLHQHPINYLSIVECASLSRRNGRIKQVGMGVGRVQGDGAGMMRGGRPAWSRAEGWAHARFDEVWGRTSQLAMAQPAVAVGYSRAHLDRASSSSGQLRRRGGWSFSGQAACCQDGLGM